MQADATREARTMGARLLQGRSGVFKHSHVVIQCIAHPPNVAAIPGDVPCILLLMTFNSSNIHVQGS